LWNEREFVRCPRKIMPLERILYEKRTVGRPRLPKICSRIGILRYGSGVSRSATVEHADGTICPIPNLQAVKLPPIPIDRGNIKILQRMANIGGQVTKPHAA